MNTIVQVKGGFDFLGELKESHKHLAYYEEGLFIETAARVIDAMETRGVTRSELARRLNVSPAYITKILRGHANLSLESLAKLAFALDLKWESILIPKNAKVGVLSLTGESGEAAIRTIETATVEVVDKTPIQDDYAHTEENRYELRIPA